MFYKIYRNTYIYFTKYIDMSKNYLGEFEELVLTMVAILGDEAYGNTIVEEFKTSLDRKVNLSAVHITLYRLEEKGLLQSSMGGSTNERGGRRKRYFQPTNLGRKTLEDIKEQRIRLWNMIPNLS